MVQEIYCDESGFTGNNLSDSKDTWFSYASVAVNHHEAKKFVDDLIQKYQIQNNELKFSKLKNSPRGQEAISEVLDTFCKQTKLAVHHKKYNLACKLFEYIFEPVLAEKNSIFYSLKFNQFVSNLIYLFFQCKSESAEQLFYSFEKMMRNKDIKELEIFFRLFFQSQETKDYLQDTIEYLSLIKDFCIYHSNTIAEELNFLKGTGTGKWILDLTLTSLVSLLADWGQQFDELQVFCDQSKPLQDQPDFLKVMIGNAEKIYMDLGERKFPLTFNLKENINFIDSKKYPGIQIADIFAGASKFVFQEGYMDSSKKVSRLIRIRWTNYISHCFTDYSVVPDREHLDMNQISNQLNMALFHEIMERTYNSEPILEEIEFFIHNQYKILHLHRLLHK